MTGATLQILVDNKDQITSAAALCGIIISVGSLYLTKRNADRSDRQQRASEKRMDAAEDGQKKALSVSVLPILDLRPTFDRYFATVDLVNFGVGIAIITGVSFEREHVSSPNLHDVLEFSNEFDWKWCTTFHEGRDKYLRPGDWLRLIDIDKEFLLNQKQRSPWINDRTIVDLCHSIHHQFGEIIVRIQYQNAFREQMPDFLLDLSRFYPLPGAFEPEPEERFEP